MACGVGCFAEAIVVDALDAVPDVVRVAIVEFAAADVTEDVIGM